MTDEQRVNFKLMTKEMSEIDRSWSTLYRQVTGSKRHFNAIEGEIRRYSDNLAQIPESLALRYKEQVKKLQSAYMDIKEFSLKDIQKEYDNIKSIRNKYGFKSNDTSKVFTREGKNTLLSDISNALKARLDIDAVNKETVVKAGKNTADSAEHLKKQTRLEYAQLGMMALDSFEQGITQAAAAGESRYRALATESAAKGQWVKAGEEFRTARNWNLGGNIIEAGAATVRNAGAAYVATGGGIQGKIAALGVGLVTLASQILKINQEYRQIQEDLNRLKDQIVTAAAGIPNAFQELQFALSHEAIISNPLANESKIKENLQFSKQYSDYMLTNAEITKTDIDALYKKNGTNVENWSDEDVQRLHALKSEYERFMGDYEKYTKLTGAYGAANKAVEDYRIAESLKKEEEYQRYEAANEALSENRLFAKDSAARSAYDKSLKGVSEATDIKEAIRLLSEIDMTAATESINTQRARIAAYDTKINELNQKYESGNASASEVEQLVELEKTRSNAMQQLESDKDLYNGRNDVLQDLYKQQRNEVNNLASSASSSKYLAENYGSFSRYFGKTDPSLNLIKETNTVLRSILEELRYREGNNGIVYE